MRSYKYITQTRKKEGWLRLRTSIENIRIKDIISDKRERIMQSKNAVCANKVDTSIKRQISSQSAFMIKGCMYYMFHVVDTAFSYQRALIFC